MPHRPLSHGLAATSALDRSDLLLGGRGDDLLVGGSGRDVLVGEGGADDLRARDGAHDCLVGVTSVDRVLVDRGLDTRWTRSRSSASSTRAA